MTSMKVRKRSGETVSFDKTKITKAVFDAARSIDWDPGDANDLALSVTNKVNACCLRLSSNTGVGNLGIEMIQDSVEIQLEIENSEVFEAYRTYRRDKGRLREAVPNEHNISEYILHSKYLMDGESWKDCVDRCMNMHLRRFPIHESRIRQAFEFVHSLRVLPSMRSLQFGGLAIESHHARMYNCSFSLADRIEFFPHCFYLLLCGCGVGYSVQQRHIGKLPQIEKPHELFSIFHVVQDTIEGWSDALDALLQSYFGRGTPYIEFNYYLIRQRGTALITTGGKAPGHLPLKRMLEKVRSLLDECDGRLLTPFEVHRIVCLIAEAVLSGGIRRSSLMCLFDRWDTEMMYCKTKKEWTTEYPELAMANNSAVFNRNEGDEMEVTYWDQMFKAMRGFGEPGFFLTDSYDTGTNPCAEIGLDPVFEEKAEPSSAGSAFWTGFAFCNLTEINGALITSQEDLEECAQVAAFIGTLQATYSDFKFCGVTANIAERDRLLGVSITGIMDMVGGLDLRKAALCAVSENAITADILEIRHAARVTTVKPSGTASLVLGAVGSGIHPHHAKRYFRRVTATDLEPAFRMYRETNPHACEQKPNGDWIIEFPIRANGLTRSQLSTEGFLELIKTYRQDWISPGFVSGRSSHNVSATISVREGEWGIVSAWCWTNRCLITSLSFLPEIGDRLYSFTPRYEVLTPADQARWIELCDKNKVVNYHGAGRVDVDSACEGSVCEID